MAASKSKDNIRTEHKALIGIEVSGGNRQRALRRSLAALAGICEIESVSSVYQVLVEGDSGWTVAKEPETKPHSASLVASASVVTTSSANELAENLEKALKNQDIKQAQHEILLFEDQIQMVPDITLPHPELHKKPQWIVPAADVWGTAVHPILGKSLDLLRAESGFQAACRFHSQGKTLLDFFEDGK